MLSDPRQKWFWGMSCSLLRERCWSGVGTVLVRRWYGLDTGLVYPWWVEAFFVEQSVHRPLLVEVCRQTLFGEKCCLLFVNFVLCFASSFTSFLVAKISIFLQFSPQKTGVYSTLVWLLLHTSVPLAPHLIGSRSTQVWPKPSF